MTDAEKPIAEEPKTIRINVVGHGLDMESTAFRGKMTTPMIKLMNAYCKKYDKELIECHFVFDRKFVFHDSTPASLGMEDGDELDVFSYNFGG